MKIEMLITILLVLIASVSCSPAGASVSIVLPTAQPTPFLGPNLADSQGFRMTEMRDGQGRLMMARQTDGRSRFYIYEDGYDTNVGNGLLMLKAGYNYTFDMYGNRVQVEIRQTSNDQLIGYWLEIVGYDKVTGAFLGIEIPTVDTNGDRLISIQELEAALAALGEEVKGIARSQPDYARKFQTDITTAKAAISNGAISDAYHIIKQLQIELTYVKQAVQAQAAKGEATGLYGSLGAAAVILLLAGFVLVRRRRPGMHMQHANATPSIPRKAVKKPKQLESQKKAETEPRRVENEYEPEGQSVQAVVGVTVCPNCKMRVLPKSDGTCPSCQSRIMQR